MADGFQGFCETLFLWRSFVVLHITLGLVAQAIIWIGTADGTVGLVQDLLRLFKQRFDVLDQLGFVAIFLFSCFHVLDVLGKE
jgi:hypothetical protein